jgi:anti-anti-sigma regulatory factor
MKMYIQDLQAIKRSLEIRTNIDINNINEFEKWLESQPKENNKIIIDINKFITDFKQ